jgi:hypothetical protein
MVMVGSIANRGKLFVIALGAALLMVFALAGAQAASADAGAGASCMGHEASALSPPGSSDEFTDGMPEFKQFISDNFPGTPVGSIIRTIAQTHAVSHEACD